MREQAKALEATLAERERELAKAERTAAEAVGRADALIVERRELRQRMAKERSALNLDAGARHARASARWWEASVCTGGCRLRCEGSAEHGA